MLLSAPPLVTTFRVTQLLGFYATTLNPLVGRTAQLSVTLLACRALAARTFTEQLKAPGGQAVPQTPPTPPGPLCSSPGGPCLVAGPGLCSLRMRHTLHRCERAAAPVQAGLLARPGQAA